MSFNLFTFMEFCADVVRYIDVLVYIIITVQLSYIKTLYTVSDLGTEEKRLWY